MLLFCHDWGENTEKLRLNNPETVFSLNKLPKRNIRFRDCFYEHCGEQRTRIMNFNIICGNAS